MLDHLTQREQEMLEAADRVAVPKAGTDLQKAHAAGRLVDSVLFRAGCAKKLLERVRANARLALRLYMEALSLKYTQERWATGLEYGLWRATTGARQKLSEAEVEQLKVLAEEAGGWWVVPSDTDEPVFESLAEWSIRYTDWAE